MSAADKAKQLVEKYYEPISVSLDYAKKFAVITVDEIIKSGPYYFYPGRKVNRVEEHSMVEYWQEVKTEIEKL